MRRAASAGITAALSSAFFLGLAPVFGKLALNLGFAPLSVVAWRTGLAAGLVLIVFVLFFRRYLYIYPIGLAGCALAGFVNGLGSILFYMSLDRLNASVGQMLYSLYPFFAAIWLTFDDHALSRLTLLRILLATVGVALLTILPTNRVDLVGAVMMLGAAALYALHLPINQRVLYEVPPATVTLYTLLAMTAVVVPAALVFNHQAPVSSAVWWPVVGLTLITLLSRLALFFGIKRIGGMQTALLGLAELLVTLVFSLWWLRESLTPAQWLGALVLALSLLLVKFEHPVGPHQPNRRGWFAWIRPPEPQATPAWTPDE